MGHAFTDLYGPDWEKYVEEPLGDFFNEIFRKYSVSVNFLFLTSKSQLLLNVPRWRFQAPSPWQLPTNLVNISGDICKVARPNLELALPGVRAMHPATLELQSEVLPLPVPKAPQLHLPSFETV